MKSRTKARCVALQVLYEVDMTGHPPEVVFSQRIEDNPMENSLADFTSQIIYGVYPLFEKLDQFISQHAPEWPMDQVAVIDRNIIRIALWEFAVSDMTPVKVAINEAIELAKMFGADSTPRFVNGVLGSLANRQDEIHRYFGPNEK
jgi:N utilization substance protein B